MTELLARLALDAVAVCALAYGVYLPRHRRPDLVVAFVLFNAGLFAALAVIARGDVGVGVGFGLFAVLSIVRLRSEPFSHRELAYFFLALVLALAWAIDAGGLVMPAALSAAALAAAWAVDHPRLGRSEQRVEIVLELVFADDAALHRHLEERLNADVTDVTVAEIDYVRETTRACVRYVPRPAMPRNADAPVLAG
jgi:hypothetical protein